MIYGHLIWHDLYAAVAPPLPLPVSRIQFVLHSFIHSCSLPAQSRVVSFSGTEQQNMGHTYLPRDRHSVIARVGGVHRGCQRVQ